MTRLIANFNLALTFSKRIGKIPFSRKKLNIKRFQFAYHIMIGSSDVLNITKSIKLQNF